MLAKLFLYFIYNLCQYCSYCGEENFHTAYDTHNYCTDRRSADCESSGFRRDQVLGRLYQY